MIQHSRSPFIAFLFLTLVYSASTLNYTDSVKEFEDTDSFRQELLRNETMPESIGVSIPVGLDVPVLVPPWVSLCGSLAPILSIVVFMAPIPTILRIPFDRSVGSLPLLPYSSMIASASIWVIYGILVGQSKIWIPNSVGIILGSYYFHQYTKYCPLATKSKHFKGTTAIVLAVCIIAIAFPTAAALSITGSLGVTFCVCMFASPLAALKTVVETKSAKSIPLPFSIACLINCALWSVFGLLEMNDVNIYLPNLLGLMFSMVQVVLKLVYGSASTTLIPK